MNTKYVLASEPAAAQDVIAVRSNAKDNDELVVALTGHYEDLAAGQERSEVGSARERDCARVVHAVGTGIVDPQLAFARDPDRPVTRRARHGVGRIERITRVALRGAHVYAAHGSCRDIENGELVCERATGVDSTFIFGEGHSVGSRADGIQGRPGHGRGVDHRDRAEA